MQAWAKREPAGEIPNPASAGEGLVYYETYDQVQRAISREKQLKGWRREKKIALIEKMNPRWQDLAENWGREMRFRGQFLERTP